MIDEMDHSLDEGRFTQLRSDSPIKTDEALLRPTLFTAAENARKSDYQIESIFLRRWSPRAMKPIAIRTEHLMRVFEAARWAPSTYNEQEWRFLYTLHGGKDWNLFFSALDAGNQAWCSKAGALISIIGKNALTKTGDPNPVRSFDCGTAFQNLALQAASIGLIAHGMAGFSRQRIRENLKVPSNFSIEVMVALGYPGDPEELSQELRELEKPSSRKSVREFIGEGIFSFHSETTNDTKKSEKP